MRLRNRLTGEVIKVDRGRARVRRLQRRVRAWVECVRPALEDGGNRLVMVTLTYADVDAWRAGHIRAYMMAMRKRMGVMLLGYAWVAELQRRGAVHYHVLLLVRRGADVPLPDRDGFWDHGLSRVETARTPFYVLRYTGKEYQKVGSFPQGLRMFAVWVRADVVARLVRWVFRLSALPAWLREDVLALADVTLSVRRADGGGWMVGRDRFLSPWVVLA